MCYAEVQPPASNNVLTVKSTQVKVMSAQCTKHYNSLQLTTAHMFVINNK